LPLVALMPGWRQNYPNNRLPTRATAISEMGHPQTHVVQRTSVRARTIDANPRSLGPGVKVTLAGRKITVGRALAKTITLRAVVPVTDFTANYFVVGPANVAISSRLI
jgi:hypothetical protein